MTTATRRSRIDDLVEKIGTSLQCAAVFEAERMAVKALTMAHQIGDWGRMTRIIGLLRRARAERIKPALANGEVLILQQRITEETKVRPGCYLVQPPLVGADARRLRLAGLQSEVPVAVICREPKTQLGLWPIVAVGSGTIVRTRIPPPANEEAPDLEWFVGAMEALGDWAVQTIDMTTEVGRRIEAVLQRLDAVPDSESLHDVLEAICREAAEAEPGKSGDAGERLGNKGSRETNAGSATGAQP